MEDKQSWDWSTPLKEIAFKEWETQFNWVEDPCITPDGENIASIVNLDEAVFDICVNGEAWDNEFEKAWSLKAMPDNRIAVLTCEDEVWGVVVDKEPWSNQFDFIWDLSSNPDGSSICVAFQQDMEYGMAVNDEPWEETFENITGMTISQGQDTAGVVQVDSMAAADVTAFTKGLFSVAKNGQAMDERFVNIWDICFDATGSNLAWAVRTDRQTYGIAVNGTLWDARFGAVWKPIFCNDGNSVAAPVKIQGKWFLYQDGKVLWPDTYENIWHLALNPATDKLAAIVAPKFGKWSVAQDNAVWSLMWDGMVRGSVSFKRWFRFSSSLQG